MFHGPVSVLYLLENGLSMQQIFLLHSIYSGVTIAGSALAGLLSLKMGRCSMLAASTVLGFLGFLGYALSQDFCGFLLSDVALALEAGLLVTSFDPLSYETMVGLGRRKEYGRLLSKQYVLCYATDVAASLVGGLVAMVSLRATVWVSLVPAALTVWIAWRLRQPACSRTRRSDMQHKEVGTRMLGKLWPLLLLYGIVSMLVMVLGVTAQPYQQEIGLPLWAFGVIDAVGTLGSLGAAWLLCSLLKLFGERTLLLGAGLGICLSFVLMGCCSSLWGLLLIVGVSGLWAVFSPVTVLVLNDGTCASVRGTVQSLRNCSGEILVVAAAPVVGVAMSLFTLSQMMLLVGIAGSISIMLMAMLMRKTVTA
jgi:MFS family permease